MDSTIKMARGASFLVFNSSFSALIGIVAFAYISRLITKTEMGIMAVLLMVLSTCQLMSTLGLPNASTKYIAEYLIKGDRKIASAIASRVLSVNLAAASALSLICYVLSNVLSKYLLGTDSYGFLFQVLAVNILFASLLPGLIGILLGLKRFREIAVFNTVGFSLQQALAIILLASHMGLLGVIIGWLTASIFNFTVLLWSVTQSLDLSIMRQFNLKVLFRYSWPLYPVAFVSLLDNWFDRVLLLGYSLSDLGVYNVAFKAFGYLYAIPIAISDSFFPYFSEIKSSNGAERLSTTFTRTSRYLVIIVTPLALGLAIMASPVISLFAGKNYLSASQPLIVLCIAAAISVFGLMLGKIMLALEETRIYASIIISTILTGLLLGVFFVPFLGPTGASLARATSMLLTLGLMIWATTKKIKVKFDTEAFWKSWVSGIVMSFVLLIMQYMLKSILAIPVLVGISIVTYLVMLRVLQVITEKDLEFLRDFLGFRIGPPISNFLKAVLIP